MNDLERLEILADIGPDEWDELWDEIDGGYPFLGPRHYDRSGNPISMRQWSALRAYARTKDDSYLRVGSDHIGPYWISTIWLGMDHGFGGRPLIFESMVFVHYDEPKTKEVFGADVTTSLGPGRDTRRYSTLEEAQDGHQKLCEAVRAAVEAGKPYRGYHAD